MFKETDLILSYVIMCSCKALEPVKGTLDPNLDQEGNKTWGESYWDMFVNISWNGDTSFSSIIHLSQNLIL